jgi:hypothetical protein
MQKFCWAKPGRQGTGTAITFDWRCKHCEIAASDRLDVEACAYSGLQARGFARTSPTIFLLRIIGTEEVASICSPSTSFPPTSRSARLCGSGRRPGPSSPA